MVLHLYTYSTDGHIIYRLVRVLVFRGEMRSIRFKPDLFDLYYLWREMEQLVEPFIPAPLYLVITTEQDSDGEFRSDSEVYYRMYERLTCIGYQHVIEGTV